MTKINESLKFVNVDQEEIYKIVISMRSKAYVRDKINITMIQLCMPYLLPFLTHIINMCIENSYFPSEWKHAFVIPTPNVKQPKEYGQLRSISILPALSKILEKVLKTQIRNFINQNNILPLKQSCFRPGYSCATALADLVDDILRAQDNNKLSILILLDYTKAFDMLNHQILLATLSHLGFGMSAISLISSFLCDRKQQVVLGSVYSESAEVKTGVPEGSILGPLLYTLYTSKFHESIKTCEYHLYADDTQLYYSFNYQETETAIKLINKDLKNIYDTSLRHLLQINPKKCYAILFGGRKNAILDKFNINIGGTPIEISEKCKSLGVIIDSKLKFKENITPLGRRAYASLKMIFSHRSYLSVKTKRTLCESLVLSHFNHCDVVYAPCLNGGERQRIQKVQNSCLRFINGLDWGSHVSHKLKNAGWLDMVSRRQHHLACLCLKIVKFGTPPYLLAKLEYRTDVHHLNLRRRNTISIPKHRGERFKGSFSYRACQVSELFGRF